MPTETIQPFDEAIQPEWHTALAEQFAHRHLVDDNTGNAVGFVITWFLNGQFAPQCSIPRQASLSDDRTSWEATIVAMWQDHADLQFPFFLHYVAPEPPGDHIPGRLGHILIVQMPVVHHAAVLLTRSIQTDEATECLHLAVYILNRLSAGSARFLVVPPPLLARLSFSVRRDGIAFPEEIPQRISNGENIIVDSVSSSSPSDESCQLQVLGMTPLIFKRAPDFLVAPTCCTLLCSSRSLRRPMQPHDDKGSQGGYFHPPDSSFSIGRTISTAAPCTGWQAPLWTLLQREGSPDRDEDGPVIFVNSFYINHLHHPREAAPRPLRLDRDFHDWENDIKLIWERLARAQFAFRRCNREPPTSFSSLSWNYSHCHCASTMDSRSSGLSDHGGLPARS